MKLYNLRNINYDINIGKKIFHVGYMVQALYASLVVDGDIGIYRAYMCQYTYQNKVGLITSAAYIYLKILL